MAGLATIGWIELFRDRLGWLVLKSYFAPRNFVTHVISRSEIRRSRVMGQSLNLLGFAKRLFRTSQAITFAALMRGDQFELVEVSLFAFMLFLLLFAESFHRMSCRPISNFKSEIPNKIQDKNARINCASSGTTS